MSGHNLSCSQRIRRELARRDDLYADLWRHLDAPDATGHDASALYDELEPLGADVHPVIRIQLIWGGPADWLEIDLEDDSRCGIRRMTYHLADGADRAEREVAGHEAPALWRTARYYVGTACWNGYKYSGGFHD